MSRQLGQPTPCLLHVALVEVPAEPLDARPLPAPVGDYDEPYVFGQVHPTVDRPGPFTLREYVRLSVLRSRVREQRSTSGDQPAAQGQPLASR